MADDVLQGLVDAMLDDAATPGQVGELGRMAKDRGLSADLESEPPDDDDGPVDAAAAKRVSDHLAGLATHRLASLTEACVPNKAGHRRGYHDDKTGYPCRPGGSEPSGGRGRRAASHAAVQRVRAVGVSNRGQTKPAKLYDPATAAARARAALQDTQGKAEKKFEAAVAEAIGWTHDPAGGPADAAALVYNRKAGRPIRVGLDVKLGGEGDVDPKAMRFEISRSAAQNKVAWTAQTMAFPDVPGAGQPSPLFYLYYNPAAEPGKVYLCRKPGPVTSGGKPVRGVTEVAVPGLRGIDSLAKPEVVQRIREAVVTMAEQIDPEEVAAVSKEQAAAHGLWDWYKALNGGERHPDDPAKKAVDLIRGGKYEDAIKLLEES